LKSEVRNELSKKTVNEIINGWKEKLQRHAKAFSKDADKYIADDKHLYESQERVGKLADQVFVMEKQQTELEDNLQQITSYQEEMNKRMEDLERQLRQLSHSGMRQTMATMERREVYNSATELNRELNHMAGTLSDLVNGLNRSSGDSGDNVVGQIQQILNTHYTSLEYISSECQKLRIGVKDVHQKMGQKDSHAMVNRSAGYNY